LGLPICRRIVQEHQGNFNIVSTVQQGTTVFITLPTQYGQNGASFFEA
jgi:signal transduction histidine kinase